MKKMFLTPYMHTRFICFVPEIALWLITLPLTRINVCLPVPPRMLPASSGSFSCCARLALVEAQVESGKIVGTVKDASGAVVSNAAVKVTETQTNVVKTTKTDSNGEYVVTELKSGEYTVAVEHQGFKKALQAAFKLDVNQVVRVDITLAVGSISEEMVVTAAAPLIESETSSLGQVIEQSRVQDMPLDGRDFVELAYLTPGVNSGPNCRLHRAAGRHTRRPAG